MGQRKDGPKNSATTVVIHEPAEERTPVAPEADRAPEEAPQGVPVGETTATEAPEADRAPEDFERHSLAQLKAGKAKDMALRADLERQLVEVRDREARRDAVFAPRFLQEATAKKIRNPILEINGVKLVPRQKKGMGGFITYSDRATLDIP